MEKRPGDPVTEADLAADRLIRSCVSSAFPEDGWLSEETADDPERLRKRRVWVVDPIDGTREFVRGVAEFVVSVGFCVDGTPVLGAVVNPAERLVFRGVVGHGAFLNDAPIAPSVPVSRPKILVSRTETAKGLWTGYEDRVETTACGSIAYKICQAAAGRCDGVVTRRPRSEWDIAGAVAVMRAAGGVVREVSGEELLFNRPVPRTRSGLVASHPRFVEALLSATR